MLTASGGPFRGRTREQMRDVTPAEALAHPTWAMGRVITTNSATLVNKGLELLEAYLLYGVDLDRIDVVVHPQSIVHSMVQFVDGSTLAQCSPPDMRLPIALGLSWPERLPGGRAGLRLVDRLELDVRAAGHRGVPRGGAGPAGRPARRQRAGGLQRGQRGVRRGLPRRARSGSSTSATSSSEVLDEHAGPAPEDWGRTGADVGSTLVAGDELTVDMVLAADAWARRSAPGTRLGAGARALDGHAHLPRRRHRLLRLVMASIALHEIGHLVPGKLFGVKTTQYFVGFGKTLWSRRRGETEYGIKAIPLGGYVRFVGMYPPEPEPARPGPRGAYRDLPDHGRQRPGRGVGDHPARATTAGCSTRRSPGRR